MTISKTSNLVSVALAASMLVPLVGCGGGGGASNSGPSSFPKGIYFGSFSDALVRNFKDMAGSSPHQFTIPGGDHARCTAFDAEGHMYVGGAGKIYRFDTPDSAQPISFGSQGSGTGQFDQVRSIAFDSQGRIYVMDQNNKRVVRLNNISGSGWTVLDLNPHLPANIFSSMTLALDSQGRIYVSVWTTDQIFRFDSMSDATPDSLGSHGSGVKQFSGPACVYIDSNDQIYIADQGNDRIVRMINIEGTGWTTYGSPGNSVGQFLSPIAVSTDSSGRIYVTDFAVERIARVDNMSGTGWVTFGDGAGQEQLVNEPLNILVR